MGSKHIKISVRGAELVPLASLVHFQDEIKSLSKTRFEKLRKSILTLGLSFTVHIWRNKGSNNIIGGHQTCRVLEHLVSKEGYLLEGVPVSIVEADSFEEAKRKVLAGAAQYGNFDKQGLYKYMMDNEIPFDDLVSTFEFEGINFEEFGKNFFDDSTDENDIDGAAGSGIEITGMKVSSDQVRQVQLFFDLEKHQEFMEKVKLLTEEYGTQNVTDTVMEAVREAHSLRENVTK